MGRGRCSRAEQMQRSSRERRRQKRGIRLRPAGAAAARTRRAHSRWKGTTTAAAGDNTVRPPAPANSASTATARSRTGASCLNPRRVHMCVVRLSGCDHAVPTSFQPSSHASLANDLCAAGVVYGGQQPYNNCRHTKEYRRSPRARGTLSSTQQAMDRGVFTRRHAMCLASHYNPSREDGDTFANILIISAACTYTPRCIVRAVVNTDDIAVPVYTAVSL